MYFLNNIFFPLAQVIVRIQYRTQTIYKMCGNLLFLVCVRLPQEVLGKGVKNYMWTFDCTRLGTLSPHIVQGSTIVHKGVDAVPRCPVESREG